MKTFLMCSPDHYNVDYVINPWMEGNIHAVDPVLAKEQWQHLHDWIVEQGATVHVMSQKENLPDQVFATNFGIPIVDTNKFIISTYRSHERRPETEWTIEWCGNNGWLPIFDPQYVFEGGGDAIYDRFNYLWLGYGFRTDVRIVEKLRKHISNVVPLQLVDQRFYHLDTCFKPLPMGDYLFYPDAFDYHSRWAMGRYATTSKLIAVDEQDACKFACNIVNVGNALYANDMSDQLKGTLEDRGYSVTLGSLSEFIKSGGSAACMALYLGDL